MEEKDLGALIESGLKDLASRIEESRAEARQRFEQVDGRIEETRIEVRQRFEQVEGEISKTQVQIESMRGSIQQLAEGIANVDEKLDRHAAENSRQFDDVRAMMHLSYVQIEQRVSTLEDH